MVLIGLLRTFIVLPSTLSFLGFVLFLGCSHWVYFQDALLKHLPFLFCGAVRPRFVQPDIFSWGFGS